MKTLSLRGSEATEAILKIGLLRPAFGGPRNDDVAINSFDSGLSITPLGRPDGQGRIAVLTAGIILKGTGYFFKKK